MVKNEKTIYLDPNKYKWNKKHSNGSRIKKIIKWIKTSGTRIRNSFNSSIKRR